VSMIEAYLKDYKRVMPCASYLNGEYGIKGMYLGVPAVLGAGGVEKVIELELTDSESELFQKSSLAVKGVLDICKTLNTSLASEDYALPLHFSSHSIA